MFVLNGVFLNMRLTGVVRYSIELLSRVSYQMPDVRLVYPYPTRYDYQKRFSRDVLYPLRGFSHPLLWEQINLQSLVGLGKFKGSIVVTTWGSGMFFYGRQICVVHDTCFISHPEWYHWKLAAWFRITAWRCVKNSLKIITVSEFSKRSIIDYYGISEDKVVVVPAAPSLNGAKIDDGDIKVPWNEYILYVSSIEPRKNLVRLAKAFLNVITKSVNYRHIKLVIAGDRGPVSGDVNIPEFIRNSSNIVFAGRVSDSMLRRLYENALFFVYPSFCEGFGLPPAEAMSLGCPVIISNTSAMPEVCGDAAYYVDPYDVDSIGNAIRLLLDSPDLRKELSEKGVRRAKELSWDKSADRFCDLLRSL